MKDRSFADFMVGVLACVSVFGLYAVARETELLREGRRRLHARWTLPGGARVATPEDHCRHCAGAGHCPACGPSCRVCRGSGRQPRDAAQIMRLTALWNGA